MNISLQDFARALYLDNEKLDEAALQILREALGKDNVETVTDMRAVAMALDRTRYPTAVIIRFSRDDIRFEQINGISCPVDRHDHSVSAPSGANGWYEPHLVACLKKISRPGMVAIDIGANVGYHTLLLATLAGPEGRCFAFEPNSENCRLILIGCDENRLTNVTLVPVGLSDNQGWAYFSTHIGSNGGVVSEQCVALSGNGGIVPMFTLDSFGLQNLDVIKVDIEGGEYRALKGGEGVLRRCRPAIVSEFSVEMSARVSGVSAAAYLGWIASLDYAIFLVERDGGRLVPIHSVETLFSTWGNPYRIEDFLFLPREHSAMALSS